MKKIINIIIELLKRIIIGRPFTWIDIEVASKKVEAHTVHIGWHIPKMEVINTTLVNGDVTVTYMGDTNTIDVNGTELTITSRIFTKVSNVLKKSDVEPITKTLWTEFEDGLIDAQGKGKKTYSSLRHPVKKT